MAFNNYAFLILLVANTAYAVLRGGAPERIGAALYAAGSVATLIVVSSVQIRFRGVEAGIFAVDALVFLGFVLLALRANRFWPLWVSALVGLGLAGHLVVLADRGVMPWAYAVVLSIWSYPILALMAAGTWRHRRRLIRNGADPSWTPFSARAGRTTPRAGPTP